MNANERSARHVSDSSVGSDPVSTQSPSKRRHRHLDAWLARLGRREGFRRHIAPPELHV